MTPLSSLFWRNWEADYSRRLPGREGEGNPASCIPPPGSGKIGQAGTCTPPPAGGSTSARPHPALFSALAPSGLPGFPGGSDNQKAPGFFRGPGAFFHNTIVPRVFIIFLSCFYHFGSDVPDTVHCQGEFSEGRAFDPIYLRLLIPQLPAEAVQVAGLPVDVKPGEDQPLVVGEHR